jgi:hypothetical protein
MSYIPVDLRRQIYQRANGRCEYCRFPDTDTYAPHEIDHIYAEKHGGATTENNLCLSCWLCNRHKGTDLASLDPLTGQITPLFHPRQQKWTDHFQLNGALIAPLTSEGRVTVRLLQLNQPQRIQEREIMIALNIYP